MAGHCIGIVLVLSILCMGAAPANGVLPYLESACERQAAAPAGESDSAPESDARISDVKQNHRGGRRSTAQTIKSRLAAVAKESERDRFPSTDLNHNNLHRLIAVYRI